MHSVLAFLAGMFAINSVPHLVQGVCGKPFRTPFVRFSGGRQSGPIVNVLWGWLNAVVAYWLAFVAAPWQPLPFAIGALVLGCACAAIFARDH